MRSGWTVQKADPPRPPVQPELAPYLEDDDPQTWPWQLKFFLAAAICLVVEIVVIAIVNGGLL